MPRLFVALWPPADVAAMLAEQARAMAQAAHGWAMRQDSIHLTLAFLGDVPAERLAVLQSALAGCRGRALTLTIDTLGYWRHQRLFWAGCRHTPPRLEALVRTVHDAVTRAGFAVNRSPEQFAPHLTLVRKARLAGVPVGQPSVAQYWCCREFALIESTPAVDASHYRTLERYPLTEAA